MRGIARPLAVLVLAGCGLAVPEAARAPAIIGVIQGVSPDLATPRIDALRAGLETLGHRDGREIRFELRYLEGGAQDRAAELTRELVALGAAVIVTGNPAGVEGARRATTTTPIVMAGVGTDPVGDGWVVSLARPGGNLTGISLQVPTISGRRLQLLREMVPAATRIGVLHDATASAKVTSEVEEAARSLGVGLHTIVAKDPSEIEPAFASFRASAIDAVHVNVGAVFGPRFSQLAAAASAQRIATSFGIPEAARAGGLFALGPEQTDLYRRAAGYVDKILRGARAGDLPVEQPTRFELVLNAKTARTIGLTIPDPILAQATEVIR